MILDGTSRSRVELARRTKYCSLEVGPPKNGRSRLVYVSGYDSQEVGYIEDIQVREAFEVYGNLYTAKH